jgi:hypothetical protein
MQPKHVISAVTLAVALAAPQALASEPTPSPTPAGHPRSLTEFAGTVRLDGERARDAAGRVVISNRTVVELAPDGMLTSPTSSPLGVKPLPTPPPVEDGVRRRWQKAYAAQHRVIRRLEEERATLLQERDELARRPLTAGVLAREEGLRAELERLDERLGAARDALARIVHRARQDGAEPGWFRGLP